MIWLFQYRSLKLSMGLYTLRSEKVHPIVLYKLNFFFSEVILNGYSWRREWLGWGVCRHQDVRSWRREGGKAGCPSRGHMASSAAPGGSQLCFLLCWSDLEALVPSLLHPRGLWISAPSILNLTLHHSCIYSCILMKTNYACPTDIRNLHPTKRGYWLLKIATLASKKWKENHHTGKNDKGTESPNLEAT